MKANELRIGNWVVWDDDSQEEVQVRELTAPLELEGGQEYFINGGLIGDFKPIPLTEEWLVKFGFESSWHDQIGTIWYIGKFEIIKNLPQVDAYFGICLNGIDVFVKYVHQLQNLYHALTGEELTIKL